MRDPLLIVGASARAAAESADRSGFTPLAIDQFGDVDLHRIAEVRTCECFPDEIPTRAAELPFAPVVLTGAMENHLQIVKQLSDSRPLYGCPPHVLRAVRHPLKLQQTLAQAGLPSVETQLHLPTHAEPGQWLQKPRRGSGGIGIRMLHRDAAHEPRDGVYYQRLLTGSSQSGLFMGSTESATLVGVTEQWVGTAWLHAREFGYAGSLGPLSIERDTQAAWEAIGVTVAKQFKLRGLFGVDAIVQDCIVRPVEVNPRFTASAEIIDRAMDAKIMQEHVRACCGESVTGFLEERPQRLFAKAIYFAPTDLRIPLDLCDFSLDHADPTMTVELADIPQPGTLIKKTHPVATLLAAGSDASGLRAALERAARHLGSHLTQELQPASTCSRSVSGDQRRPASCG